MKDLDNETMNKICNLYKTTNLKTCDSFMLDLYRPPRKDKKRFKKSGK